MEMNQFYAHSWVYGCASVPVFECVRSGKEALHKFVPSSIGQMHKMNIKLKLKLKLPLRQRRNSLEKAAREEAQAAEESQKSSSNIRCLSGTNSPQKIIHFFAKTFSFKSNFATDPHGWVQSPRVAPQIVLHCALDSLRN